MAQVGGWLGFVGLFVGAVGVVAGIGALLSLFASRRAGFIVGLVAIVIAALAGAVGLAGVLYGRQQVNLAVGMVDNAALAERLRTIGYEESAVCGRIGFFAALFPLVAGIVATWVGALPSDAARAPMGGSTPPAAAGHGGALRRGVALLFAALAASMAALALLVTRAVPPNARHGFAASDASAWALAEAVERVAKGELEACNALERALETLRLDTADRRALPRVFARDPEALVPGTKAAAARCLSAFVDDGSGSNDGSTTARPMRRPFGIERSSSTDLAESALVLSEELAPRQPPPAVPAPAPAALERTVAGVAAEPDGTEPSPPSNDGELDQAAIAQVVRSHSRDVRRCYEKGLRSNPNLSGRVDVTFTIAVSGRVSTARVARSTIGDEAVQACILGVVRGMRFPKPKANVTVNYPYVFARS